MTYWKTFQTNNRKIEITEKEATAMISKAYGDRNVDRHMKHLKEFGVFDTGYWLVYYES